MYHISAFIFILSWYAIYTSSLFAFSITNPKTFEVSGFCEGNLTQFSYKLTNELEEVRWDFGDPESGISNIAQGADATHRFSRSGRFFVNMILLGNGSPLDTITKSVYIYPKPTLNITSTKLCVQSPVYFELEGNLGKDQKIKTYTWDFGDGTTSRLRSPQHIFNIAGTFTVSVTILTESGCVYTQHKWMRIAPVVPAMLEVENACEGSFKLKAKDTVAISSGTRGVSSDYVERISWKLGEQELEGTRGEMLSQDFDYLKAGEYQVHLKTIMNNGCVDEQTSWVKVFPAPNSPIGMMEDTVCVGEMAELRVKEAQANLETFWFSSIHDQKPASFGTSFLTKPLSKDVEYWVQHESVQGCKSEKIPVKAYVFSPEQIELIASPLEVFLPDATIELRTTSELPIEDWTWETGDGNTLSGAENIYTYDEAGEYFVKLYAENSLGCQVELEEIIKVKKIAGVSFPPAFTPNGDGKNDVLNIRCYDLAEWSLRIYDLSGNLVYESSELDPVWDGKNLENHLVKTGIYICVVDAIGNNGEKISESKRVTVIR